MRLPVFLSLSALMLSACDLPSPMPAGYSYHQGSNKVPPGPQPDSIGYQYSAAANKQVLEIWKDIAVQFVDSLETKHSLSSKNMHLVSPFLSGAQTQSFDYALREEMVKRGYNLVPQAKGVVTINTRIENPSDEDLSRHSKKSVESIRGYAGNPGDFLPQVLSATISKGGTLKSTLREIYTVPNFGHMPDHGGYKLKLSNPVMGHRTDSE